MAGLEGQKFLVPESRLLENIGGICIKTSGKAGLVLTDRLARVAQADYVSLPESHPDRLHRGLQDYRRNPEDLF